MPNAMGADSRWSCGSKETTSKHRIGEIKQKISCSKRYGQLIKPEVSQAGHGEIWMQSLGGNQAEHRER
jgi:hypothetical protein